MAETDPMNKARARHINRLAGVSLVALAVLAYLPIINNYPVADDFAWIAKVSDIRFYEFWKLFLIQSKFFVRPAPFFSIWLFNGIFGMEWIPSHLLNVVMHGGTGVLLYNLFDKVRINKLTGFLAASLFVLTPLAPEAVTWTSGRFDVWALFFIMLTLLLYAAFMKNRSRAAYAGALVAATVALLSKESAIIIFILVAAFELLFSSTFSREPDGAAKHWRMRLSRATVRVGPFVALSFAYLVLRYAITGALARSTSYLDLTGAPNLLAPARTMVTLLAPLDRVMFSKDTVVLLALYMGLLSAASLIIVIARWRKTPEVTRRLWLFFVVFFLATLIPVYSSFFVKVMSSYLTNSRYFYNSDIALVSLLVLGLLGFGWKTRPYRTAVIVLLVLVMPVYYWGLSRNNQVWEDASTVSRHISEETYRLLPDPPPAADLYFSNVPISRGSHIYASALEYSIPLAYGRRDLNIFYVNPDPALSGFFQDQGPAPAYAYLFVYDLETGQLALERTPPGP